VIHVAFPLVLAAILAGAGVYGILVRRNAVLVLIGIELILNAANLILVTFDAAYADTLRGGQVLTMFVITIAAAEISVALAVILLLFRHRGDIDLRQATELAEQLDGPPADRRPS
jgi:NADH-quinone oxidoreductase subunit K